MSVPKKIYTCTPVPFEATEHFWSRDTGLICRQLIKAGIESKCIMPLPSQEGDTHGENLIRVSMEDLKSTEWWKSLQLDGLVLYSWGAPKYNGIVRAAHAAGVKIMIHLDRGLCLMPFWDPSVGLFVNVQRKLKAFIFNVLSGRHLLYADYVSASYPLIEVLKKSKMFTSALNSHYRVFACPVASHFVYDGTPKEEKVVCVGRWSDEAIDAVKRPEFLRAVAERFVEIDNTAPFEIYGRCGETMKQWYEQLPPHKKKRIKLMGAVPNEQLVRTYQQSMICICPSRSEGTHIASAEALNCGASIVVGPQPRLGVLHWYISQGAGTIAAKDEPESFSQAVVDEMNCWRRGERDPQRIANAFNENFHAAKAILRIFKEGSSNHS